MFASNDDHDESDYVAASLEYRSLDQARGITEVTTTQSPLCRSCAPFSDS